MKHRFERGPEGWCSYDYHASMVDDGRNVFILTTWDPGNGKAGGNAIWTNHRRWSADTPERPLSILPLLYYHSWMNEDPVDLRDAEVSVYLRGDDLVLDGASCLFWVHGPGGRWHLDSVPLTISMGGWADEPNCFRLVGDEAKWHHSWPQNETSRPLAHVLEHSLSYGFSFVGFRRLVTGRLAMCEFEINLSA